MTFGKALNYAFGQLISFLVKFFRLTSFLCFLSYGYIVYSHYTKLEKSVPQ